MIGIGIFVSTQCPLSPLYTSLISRICKGTDSVRAFVKIILAVWQSGVSQLRILMADLYGLSLRSVTVSAPSSMTISIVPLA